MIKDSCFLAIALAVGGSVKGRLSFRMILKHGGYMDIVVKPDRDSCPRLFAPGNITYSMLSYR